MNGLHLIADLHDCHCPREFLCDQPALERYCTEACQRHGLQVVGRVFHAFGEAAGVTGAVILAESHLTLHTWPEIASVTLDLYVCNFSDDNSGKARALFAEIITRFAPEQAQTTEVGRGRLHS